MFYVLDGGQVYGQHIGNHLKRQVGQVAQPVALGPFAVDLAAHPQVDAFAHDVL